MADIFDVNQYKSENTRLTLTSHQKCMIIANTYQAYKTMKKTNSKTKMNFFAKSIAAVLVLVLIVGVGFVGFGNHTKPNNWFSVDVNAATATYDESSHAFSGNSVVNGYSQSAMSGFFMEDETGTITKDGYKVYFVYYHMDNLSVMGANVKSVEFKSEKKGVYFTLTPEDSNADYLSDTSYIDSVLTDYIDRGTLNNSGYTFDELRRQAPYLLWPCDGFKYDNGKVSSGEEDNLLPVNHIDIILESDHSDPEIAELVKEIGNINSRNESNSYEQYSGLEEKIQKKMFDGAQIIVTVTYEDDSTETQVIDLVYKGNRGLAFDVKK